MCFIMLCVIQEVKKDISLNICVKEILLDIINCDISVVISLLLFYDFMFYSRSEKKVVDIYKKTKKKHLYILMYYYYLAFQTLLDNLTFEKE